MRLRVMMPLVATVVFGCSSAWGWGLPSLPTVGGGSGGGDPDAFLAKAQVAEALVNKSADQLFGLVSSKEAQAKVEELQKRIDGTTDSSEKGQLIQEKQKSELAALEQAKTDNKLVEEAKHWDAQKKKLAASALFNLSLGGKMASDLVPQGQQVAASIKSNPLLVTKINSIYGAVKSLTGIGSGTVKVLGAIPPIFKAAKIDVNLATSSAAKPQSTDL